MKIQFRTVKSETGTWTVRKAFRVEGIEFDVTVAEFATRGAAQDEARRLSAAEGSLGTAKRY